MPRAPVHEAYLRLVELDRITWESRAHFFGAAAEHVSLEDAFVLAREQGPSRGVGRAV